MTKLQRRLYMLFFIALFLVTAPVLVLFAQGYRFDRTGRIFVYSGSVTIKSWPRDIDVYIDGKKKDKKNLNVINNSYTINGIRPGNHPIRAEKDGHTSWTKDIEVHSGISTEFWNVVLFPTENREVSDFDTKEVEQFFISPRDENEIVFLSKDENQRKVSLLNVETGVVEEIFTTDELEFLPASAEENIEWSSDNKRILIPFEDNGQKTYIIARIKKENLENVVNFNEVFGEKTKEEETIEQEQEGDVVVGEESEQEIADDKPEIGQTEPSTEKDIAKFEKVRWMFDKNDELVALTREHELYYVDINKPEEKVLLDTQVSGFDFAGNRIYYTQMPNNIAWEIKDNNTDTKRQITNQPIPVPENSFLRLTAYDQYRIAFETSNQQLFLFNKEKEKNEESMEKLSEGVKGVQFSNDGKKLLYWTSNEIWVQILREWKVQPVRQKGDKIFITRFSSMVHNVQWMDDYENIVFTIGDSTKSANIDTRWGTHIVDVHQLSSGAQDRDVVYDKQNQLLFTRTKQDDKFQLQTVQLIDKGFFGL